MAMSIRDRDNQIKAIQQNSARVPIVLPSECYNNTIYGDDFVTSLKQLWSYLLNFLFYERGR